MSHDTNPPQRDVLAGFDAFAHQMMQAWRAPGLAIGIVRDGEIVLCQGYGVRDQETQRPVTPDTLFAIGSATKAFTTTGLALLADQGQFDWDAPIKTYLPTFQLQDAVATERATARDLASHRVGLPRHDMFWYNSPFSRQEMFARLRYLAPSADFRVRWQYQSLMYLALGLATEQLSGSAWESYLHDHLFTPLGMQRSSFSATLAERDDDVAAPYKLWPATHQPVRVPFAPTPFERDPIGPAGSIKSSVRELLPWLLLHLNKGQHGARRLLSEAQLTQTHRPNMVIDDPALFPETPYKSYALGWFVEPYRGFSVLHHGGNIDGFSARLSFLPEEQIGVVILSNLETSVLPTLLSYHLYDRLLGLEIRPWHERLQHQVALVQAMASQRQEGGQAAHRSGAPSAHPQEDYLGTFMHPGYGTVEIGQDAQGLTWTYNQITSPLTHRHYEIFDLVIARYDLRRIVSFTTNADGEIASLSANLEPTVSDIVFTRVAPVIENRQNSAGRQNTA